MALAMDLDIMVTARKVYFKSYILFKYSAGHSSIIFNILLIDIVGWEAKFWDCCGEVDQLAKGCRKGIHAAYL